MRLITIKEAIDDASVKEITLTKQALDVLKFLHQNAGHAFTREDLIRKVWNGRSIVLARVIDKYIHDIKKKIGKDCIISIKGVGYKFNPEYTISVPQHLIGEAISAEYDGKPWLSKREMNMIDTIDHPELLDNLELEKIGTDINAISGQEYRNKRIVDDYVKNGDTDGIVFIERGGFYEIEDGHHRWDAAILRKDPSVNAYIIHLSDDEETPETMAKKLGFSLDEFKNMIHSSVMKDFEATLNEAMDPAYRKWRKNNVCSIK